MSCYVTEGYLVLCLQGLKRIYTHKETDSDDEWEDEEEGEEEVVHTDEEDHEPSSNKMGGGGSDGAAADVEGTKKALFCCV